MKTKKFLWIDWAILALMLCGVILAVFGIWKVQNKATPQAKIECLLCLPATDQVLPIQVGDEVRNENGTVLLGKVTELLTMPSKTVFLRDEDPVYDLVEGLWETEVTVRMTAAFSGEYRVRDIRICAGSVGAYQIGQCYVAGVRTVFVKEVET